ncbi:BBE domain-containing protein [Kitasatospora sp. NPDC047058]
MSRCTSSLQRTKKTWDPKNVFHHAQSITLPS